MKTMRNGCKIFLSLLIPLGLFSISCTEEELEPSENYSYILNFKGKILNGVDTSLFSISPGNGVVADAYSIIDGNNVRQFIFDFNDTTGSNNYNLFELGFVSVGYANIFYEYNDDLDSTLMKGKKMFMHPDPISPEQFNTFFLTVGKADDVFYSVYDSTHYDTIRIDSVGNINWFDGIDYKLVYLSFPFCSLISKSSANKITLLDCEAILAFRRE